MEHVGDAYIPVVLKGHQRDAGFAKGMSPLCRQHEQKMEEAVCAWGAAKEAVEKRWAEARDAASGAWLSALQQGQACAAEQLLSAQRRWNQVRGLCDIASAHAMLTCTAL